MANRGPGKPFKSGVEHPNWKGGIKHKNGYILLFRPYHLYADADGYVMRAILVWEVANGRLFPAGMEPHHKNGTKTDDHPENIEPKTHGQHSKEHIQRDLLGRFIKGDVYART